MSTSAQQIRAWNGPQILGYGFRPFFLGAALYAAFAMVAWIGALTGAWTIPSAFGPVEWHVHEFLWGYLSAVVAGFMLTAVPNWTGRLPIVGGPLAVLWSSWLLGRIAVFFSAGWPPVLTAALDLSFLAFLIAVLAREIIAGRNWRNLKVLVMVGLLLAGNATYHAEMMRGGMAHDSLGLRIGLASAVLCWMPPVLPVIWNSEAVVWQSVSSSRLPALKLPEPSTIGWVVPRQGALRAHERQDGGGQVAGRRLRVHVTRPAQRARG